MRDGLREAKLAGQKVADSDPELLATTIMVFILGLAHMETIAPRLIGDADWRDFVEARVAELLSGARLEP